MYRLILMGVILLFATNLFSQEDYSISGTVSDAESSETIIGATILIKELPGTGTITNTYGYFSIGAPKGKYTISVSYIGYETVEKNIDLSKDIKLNFSIKPSSELLEEVVITGEKKNSNITDNRVGVEKLQTKEVNKIPVLFGEKDIIKALTLTSGVKTTSEGSGGMFVRGGNNSQNLVMLDEATVYNTSHLMGFFSVFNSDAIKDISMYKGTAPAEYSGRISSVMDVRMNEGNKKEYHGGGGIGLLSSRVNFEGPLVKDKGSFLVTARRTYADLFLKLSSDDKLNSNQLYFYDLNAKANYTINDNNRIYFSAYTGRDVISVSDQFGMDWGNITASLRWNHIWNSKLFSNTSLIHSNYDYKVGINNSDDGFSLTSIIDNWTLNHKFQYYMNNKNTLTFGISSQYHNITPGQVDSENTSLVFQELENRYALENSVYFSNDWKPNSRLKVSYGAALNMFHLLGPGNFYSYENGNISDTLSYASGELVKSFVHLEPRLNMTYILNETSSIKASYTRNTQNLHLVQNSSSSSPTDIWIPSSNNVDSEISDQIALGYFKNFSDNEYQLSSEIYYRWMQNQIDLRNGAQIMANQHLEGELLFGSGRAYGLELTLKKKYGRFNGWISYTLSRTEKKIDGINENNWYPARQDATHDISIVGIYDLSKKWSLSASWVYNTGNAVTFPSGKYMVDGEVEFYYTERNGYRAPDYHRLDLAATWTNVKRKNFESSWSFSLYNAYGRKNAYSIGFEVDEYDPRKTIAKKTYLFTFMPSITYNFKF